MVVKHSRHKHQCRNCDNWDIVENVRCTRCGMDITDDKLKLELDDLAQQTQHIEKLLRLEYKTNFGKTLVHSTCQAGGAHISAGRVLTDTTGLFKFVNPKHVKIGLNLTELDSIELHVCAQCACVYMEPGDDE